MDQITVTASKALDQLTWKMDEIGRLHALRALDILDSPPEGELNDLVELAAAVCGTPISSVTLVDEARCWIKAAIGLETGESCKDVSFCAHAVESGLSLFVVDDTELDPRFAAHPMVVGGPAIRFYAGMPLRTTSGHSIGALCVVDTVPRTLPENQARALKVLADQVMVRIELRHQRRVLEAVLLEKDKALEEKEAALREKEQVAQGLKESESLFRLFMNHSPFASFIKDGNGRLLYYNHMLADRFGVSQTEWLGRTDAEIWPADVAEVLHRNDLEALRGGGTVEVIDHTEGTDGEMISWKSTRFPYLDNEGNMLLAGISIDISEELRRKTELERANTLLQQLATLDGLTGINNRRSFEERLHNEFALYRRTGRNLSVLMIDIDDFKRRNDMWGHAAGDEVLRALGAILASTVRLTDTAARYGGEEFVILLPDTDEAHALGLAVRLKKKIAEHHWEFAPVTLSFGVTTVSADMLHSDSLMRAADAAMYGAKRAGKDRIQVSDGIFTDALVGGKS